jgi:hypothetical protein
MNDARNVHQAMDAVPGLKLVHFVARPMDIVAYAEIADQAALLEMVGKLRGVTGVATADTRIVLPM